MNRYLTVLDRRNRLFVKILWGMLALGVVVDIAIGLPLNLILALVLSGGVMCGITTFLTYRRLLIEYIMYFVPFVLMTITLMLIVMDPAPVVSTYFLVYVAIGAMMLYANYKAIIVSGVLGMVLTAYLFADYNLADRLFPGDSLIYLFMYLIFFTAALAVAARFSERLQQQVARERQEALQAKERNDQLLGQLKASIATLSEFSQEQKGEMRQVGQISQEVTHTFQDMSKAVESQTSSLMNISEVVKQVEQLVDELARNTADLQTQSEEAAEWTGQGERKIAELAGDVEQVRAMMAATVQEMQELSKSNEEVKNIVSAIREISDQTNLLSLNAAIEAARAGEQGMGFAVVAGEIRKLADRASRSTGEIEGILNQVHSQIANLHERVMFGERMVADSYEGSQEVKQIFGSISANMQKVKTHSDIVGHSMKSVHDKYARMAADMSSVAAISEQNMASIQEVCASMENQDGKIHHMIHSYGKLDALVGDLQQTAGNAAK